MAREVTLIDGTVVDSNSPLWAAECLQRNKHLRKLRLLHESRNREGYAAHLDEIERTEGLEARKRVVARYKEVHK